MRRRLLLTYLSLLTGVLLALEVPLAVTFAARETQAVFIDRLNDTARFASLAEPALRTGQTVTLRAELVQYDQLYGIGTAVVDRDGHVLAASRQPIRLGDREVHGRLQDALSGESSGIVGVLWPWQSRPLVVSEPVGLLQRQPVLVVAARAEGCPQVLHPQP